MNARYTECTDFKTPTKSQPYHFSDSDPDVRTITMMCSYFNGLESKHLTVRDLSPTVLPDPWLYSLHIMLSKNLEGPRSDFRNR